MKSLSFSSFLVGSTLTGLLLGCDSQQSGPTPAGTAVQGQVGRVTPAPTVDAVALSSTTTPVTTALRVPAADGSYRFDSLTAGTYTLSFMSASGYMPPPARTVQVTAGATSTIPLITPSEGQYRFGSQGTAAYRVDTNMPGVGTVLARQTGNSLQIALNPGLSSAGRQLSLQLTGFAGRVGTFYTDNQTVNAHLAYRETTGADSAVWRTTAGISGSVVVTAVSVTPRRVSGTFTAVVSPALNATANRSIVGYFNEVPY